MKINIDTALSLVLNCYGEIKSKNHDMSEYVDNQRTVIRLLLAAKPKIFNVVDD